MFSATYSKRAASYAQSGKRTDELAVRNAKPKGKRYPLADALGLHLEVLPTDRKSWFARYRLPDGKQRTEVPGLYPYLSLAEVRAKSEEIQLAGRTGGPIIGARAEAKMRVQEHMAEQLLAQQAVEKAERYSFTRLSEAWLASRTSGWADESYRKARYVVRERLQPAIGKRDMRTLCSPDVTETLRSNAATTPLQSKIGIHALEFCVLSLELAQSVQLVHLYARIPNMALGGFTPKQRLAIAA